MTSLCVCGHLESSHHIGDMGCMGNRTRCHCRNFQHDDGTDGPNDESYLGIPVAALTEDDDA